MRPPGKLLATGRDCDVFEYGPGLVLRRSRRGRSMSFEARIMDYVGGYGYPVPAVVEMSDDATSMVMERIEGPTMLGPLTTRPWRIRSYGAMLADLHIRLHDIPAPDFLEMSPFSHGDRIMHLDLHPLNVMLGPAGPVVIDWSNAARGDPAFDACLAWVLIESGQIPGGVIVGKALGLFRSLLTNSFLGRFDIGQMHAVLRDVVTWKVQDPNMSGDEQRRMWELVSRVEAIRS
jgi:aminoglycoside phosphotransferase (APT) family kinase protein